MGLLPRLRAALAPWTVHAHCDIPCGIYDPHQAQLGAHTVLRMMDLIHELEASGARDLEARNKLARYIAVKEQHAEIVKHEARILWGDYFTEEHLQAYPDLHTLVWTILKQAGKAKQTTDRRVALELLESVNTLAEVFWRTKDKDTREVPAAYPTGKALVVPELR